jgi:hypothetical protein
MLDPEYDWPAQAQSPWSSCWHCSKWEEVSLTIPDLLPMILQARCEGALKESLAKHTAAGRRAHLGEHLIEAERIRFCRVVLELYRPAAAILCAVIDAIEALRDTRGLPLANKVTILVTTTRK